MAADNCSLEGLQVAGSFERGACRECLQRCSPDHFTFIKILNDLKSWQKWVQSEEEPFDDTHHQLFKKYACYGYMELESRNPYELSTCTSMIWTQWPWN